LRTIAYKSNSVAGFVGVQATVPFKLPVLGTFIVGGGLSVGVRHTNQTSLYHDFAVAPSPESETTFWTDQNTLSAMPSVRLEKPVVKFANGSGISLSATAAVEVPVWAGQTGQVGPVQKNDINHFKLGIVANF
jgi:hypothetical protein